MAAENYLFKAVSADPFSFLFLSSPDRSLCCPRRRSQPALPALLVTTGPAPSRRALPRAAQRPCAWDARAPACRRHHRPEPPSTAVQSPALPPSTAAVQSTPSSSPLKAPFVRYFFLRYLFNIFGGRCLIAAEINIYL
jgi:hypothetical protein